jgi:purine-binding chemotaxis protein CheW
MQDVSSSSPAAASRAGGGAGELLTFALDRETFAIPVDAVREVVDLTPATAVPNAPAFARALINVRGNVVALIDLRRRLSMPPPPPDAETRVVVSEVVIAGEPTLVGLQADAVHEVIDARGATLEAIPKLGTRWRPELVKGVVKQDRGFVIILDLARILASDESARRSVD